MPQPSVPAASTPDPGAQLMQLASGHIIVACIGVAGQLKIADALAAGPKPVSELAQAGQVNEDALYRVLRTLASFGVFSETSPRTFANTPISEALREGPRSIRDMVLWMANPLHFRTYAEVMYSVKTGDNVIKKITGMEPFEYLQHDKMDGDLFHAAMTSFSAMCVSAVMDAYDFSGLGTLADIAGGHGFVLTSILQKHDDLKGILFDQQAVVTAAAHRIESQGLGSRCHTIGGDFFQSVPAADNYIMKNVIHDWDDDRAAKILSNCVAAMTGKGKVILLETVLAPGNEPHFGKLLDIEMLVFPSGRERTEQEFANLFERAGLRLCKIVPTSSPLCVIEAVSI